VVVSYEGPGPVAPPGDDEPSAPASQPLAHRARAEDLSEEEAVGGVLRWLLIETDAEAAAYLRLGPGGVEQLRVEPRGLDALRVADLAVRAQEALTRTGREEHLESEAATTRWLGVGGSKVLVLEKIPDLESIATALRFARFAIEWLAASRPGVRVTAVEQRVRSVPGVAWAEASEGEPTQIRVMLTDKADSETTRPALEAAANGAEIVIEGPQPGGEMVEPRALLVDLRMAMNTNATAEVRITWGGNELKGLGRGRASPAGRLYAVALATADAMKPLIEAEVSVEALYETETPPAEPLLVVTMSVAGERLVGAVRRGPGQDDASGARAVLDALNRRLTRLAGRSGQL
jgi:hypothetical protein